MNVSRFSWHALLALAVAVPGLRAQDATGFRPLTVERVAALPVIDQGPLPKPSPAVIAAIEGAAQWLETSAITGFAWKNVDDKGRLLVSDRPIFGNENRNILYDVSEVSRERRNGYSWYGKGPARYLTQYQQWNATHSSTPARE